MIGSLSVTTLAGSPLLLARFRLPVLWVSYESHAGRSDRYHLVQKEAVYGPVPSFYHRAYAARLL